MKTVKHRRADNPVRHNIANPKQFSTQSDTAMIAVCNKIIELLKKKKTKDAIYFLSAERDKINLRLSEARRMRRFGYKSVEEPRFDEKIM